MLTPCFDVTQDEDFVTITMRVPFAKISEAEFYIDGNSFKFYCKPYFLRLCLPGELVEDGRERAVYDIEKGTITVHVPKRNAGQYFDNLGMITALLSKKPAGTASKMTSKPLIEILPDGSSSSIKDLAEEEEEFDWQVDQQIPVEDEELQLGMYSSSYGFADQQKGVFSKLQHEIPSIVDCPDPDHMTWQERRVARLAHEEASFNPEHYLADLMESTEMMESLCHFQPAWTHQLAAWRAKTSIRSSEAKKAVPTEPVQDIIPFSDTEIVQLKELPNKEYLLDKATKRALYLGLVDIMFAYAYDHRITEGEHNVESGWTICKLSSTLSWLEVFRGNAGEVAYCSVRRSLCYPLYRHWQLVQCVLQDTRDLFHLGRRKLLQCLLAVRSILNSAEPYYIMNNLYITDYCVWIQKASAKQIQKLAQELEQVQVEKKSMGCWELEELELAAHLVAAGDDTEHEDDEDDSPPGSTCSSEATYSVSGSEHSDRDASVEAGRERALLPGGCDIHTASNPAIGATGTPTETASSEHSDKPKNTSSSRDKPTEKVGQENGENRKNDDSNEAEFTQTVGSPPSDGGIADLTEGLESLLTLQPRLHKPAQKSKLIEELNES